MSMRWVYVHHAYMHTQSIPEEDSAGPVDSEVVSRADRDNMLSGTEMRLDRVKYNAIPNNHLYSNWAESEGS